MHTYAIHLCRDVDIAIITLGTIGGYNEGITQYLSQRDLKQTNKSASNWIEIGHLVQRVILLFKES